MYSRQKGRTKRSWGSMQQKTFGVWWTRGHKRAATCESLSDGFLHMKSSQPLQGRRGSVSGARLHLRDAEFLPLRSELDSLFSCCSTKTGGEEKRPSAIIGGQIQTMFSTEWELRALETAQRSCVCESQLFGQECDADLAGGRAQFHTSERISQRKIFTAM